MYRDYSVNHHAAEEARGQARSDAQDREANDGRPPVVALPPPTPVIRPNNARLTVACPQCHAEPGEKCHNYHGYPCAPHGARKLPAQADADRRAAKHAAHEASDHRRAVVASIRKETAPETRPQPSPKPAARPVTKPATIEAEPSELDRTVQDLVKRFTCARVIHAAWDASRRLFQAGIDAR